ncbi:S8 family serine peptidase [Thermodesulfobacteriota bacterium]
MLRKSLFLIFILSFLVPNSAFPGNTEKIRESTIIYKLKENASPAEIKRFNALVNQSSIITKKELKGTKINVVKLKNIRGLEKAFSKKLKETGAVLFAEPDVSIPHDSVPNDPDFYLQWHHQVIGSTLAWDYEQGSASVKVCVLDTGVDTDHPDLVGNLVLPGYNSYDHTTNVEAVLGHGTGTAGTIGAVGNNGIGVAGVAWDIGIVPVKINYDDVDSYAYYSDMVDGIEWCADQEGVKVANLSYGGAQYAGIAEAAQYLRDRGGLLFMSAGNDGTYNNINSYPDYSSFVAVGATDSDDSLSSFSEYGPFVDIVAPGRSIRTTYLDGGYTNYTGTSFSSPMAAGLASLIYSINPEFTPSEVENIIFNTAVDLGDAGEDDLYGHGRINVFASLEAAVNSASSQYNVYYGHLHNHSNVSDGDGTPAVAYNYAKNVAGLDFFSLADHASAITNTEWTSIKAAADFYNEDGVFAAFWGFEWSSSNNYGHIAVINTDDYCTSTNSATNTFDELLSWLDTRDGVAFFNHPGREDDNDIEFNHFNSQPSDKFVGIELFNKGAGFSSYYYNDGYYSNDGNKSFYDEALERGWDIGASGGEDNHSGTWGTTQNDYRMGVLAEAKTRAAIYNAFMERRFFSTLDKNIALSFELNGQQMGSVVNPGSYGCVIKATDGDAELFTEIQLIKNGALFQSWYPDENGPVITFPLTTLDGEYYYIKVTQADGDEAISSPIFITSGSSVITAPVVSNSSATNIIMDSATLNGVVTDDGGETPEVIIYWGDNDGSTISANWEYAESQGLVSGNFSMDVINLLEDTTYYYRSYAFNSAGEDWANDTESFTTLAPGSTITEEVRVGSSMDDVEEDSGGVMYTGSTDLELVDDPGYNGYGQTVGIRFSGVNIPQGAAIQTAYIQFKCDDIDSVSTNLTIHAQETGNATAFSTGSNDVSSRVTTLASAEWSPAAWNTVGEAGLNQRTSELNAVIQEVVDRGDWNSGNAIVIIITGSGTRTAESYDGDSAGAALLHIEYTIGEPVNTPPAWNSNPVVEADATEDATYSSTLADNASDADSDPLVFAKVSGPGWLFVAANGTLSGTPSNSDVGVNSWTISVSDEIDPAVQATLNITVANTNDAPVFTNDPINKPNATAYAAYSDTLSGSATDVDAGDTLSYSKISGPDWLNVAANGALNGTPAANDAGANSWTVQVSDGNSGTDTATLDITVDNAPNQAPSFTTDPINEIDATEDAAYSSTLADDASDPENDAMTFSWVSGPAWLTVASDGTLSGTPSNSDVGANTFTVLVVATGGSDTASLNITVINTNDAPTFTVDPITGSEALEGSAYSGSIAGTATDIDAGDTLTYSKVSGPSSWLTVATDGILSGTPGESDIGLNAWIVRVEDPDGAYDETELQIFVNAAAQDIDYRANGESTTRGTVSGSYVNTQDSDNTYEVISEEIKAGKWSLLDHTWTFDIAGNTSVVFMVEAYHSENNEGDDFVFAYSTDNVIFTEMFTVTKTSDNDTSQSYELPPATSGTVYVRVTDTDNTRGNTGLDTLYVDDMLIRTSGTALEPGAAFNPSPADGAINVALDTLLTWSAGAGAEWHDVYFGTEEGNPSPVSGGLTTNSYDPGGLTEGTTYFWRIDEGNSAGTTTGPEWSFITTGGVCTPSTISVASITIELLRGSKGQSFGQATVTVIDNCGNPVSGAEVTGHFTGDFSGEPAQTVTSDQYGQAVFTTTGEFKKPVFSFVVDNV